MAVVVQLNTGTVFVALRVEDTVELPASEGPDKILQLGPRMADHLLLSGHPTSAPRSLGQSVAYEVGMRLHA